MKLTVFYEDPFWVGVFERMGDEGYSVCRVVFGSEPTDAQVKEFVLANFRNLEFTTPLGADAGPPVAARVNPKRAQREARRQLEEVGISTKAQDAMRLEIEARKVDRAEITRDMIEAEKQRRFQLKQEKRKQKHRGH